MKPRYDQEPMLRLLECYILRLVGKLSPADEDRLETMSPKLGSTFGKSGPWHEIVASQLDLDPGTQTKIKELWLSFQESSGVSASDAESFARKIADKIVGRS